MILHNKINNNKAENQSLIITISESNLTAYLYVNILIHAGSDLVGNSLGHMYKRQSDQSFFSLTLHENLIEHSS